MHDFSDSATDGQIQTRNRQRQDVCICEAAREGPVGIGGGANESRYAADHSG